MFDEAKDGLFNILSKRSKEGYLYIGFGTKSLKIKPGMEHLACFASGLIALDAYASDGKDYEKDIEWARSLAYTCYQMYMKQQTHLSPELVQFDGDEMIIKEKYSVLRPETIESFYILYKVTNDPIFQKWGWDIFLAFEKCAKVKYGYSTIHDVNDPGSYEDKMESFFPAETLKYLYLLFSSDVKVSLSTYVFNTEAHPIELLK